MDIDSKALAAMKVIEVPSTLQDAKQPENAILQEVQGCGYSEDVTFAIKLALEEAMTNAVKHGNRNDKTKTITVRFAVTRERAIILVRDQGQGFSPDSVPDPTHPDRLSLPNGRGIMLMRAYMTRVEFREGGCEICMIKENR
jgi:serine/threonine-protein kinase RsbW